MGDRIIVTPLPDDPIAALRGAFAGRGIPTEELRRLAREEENRIEDAKWERWGADRAHDPA